MRFEQSRAMHPTILGGDYLLDQDRIHVPRETEIHVTRFGGAKKPLSAQDPSAIRRFLTENKVRGLLKLKRLSRYLVLLTSNEPSVCTMRESSRDIARFAKYYDLVLTTDSHVLKTASNAVLFPYGTTFLNKPRGDTKNTLGSIPANFDGYNLKKTPTVSFLKTNKPPNSHLIVPGYPLREKIWLAKPLIEHPALFYFSNIATEYKSAIDWDGPLPNDDKLGLFSSIASIIVENSSEPNYFSEKLIDCLITRTIPIYWGAPNIGDFFDVRGFIRFETVDEMIQNINRCNLEEFYQSRSHIIETNFGLARQYARSFNDRISESIKEAMAREEAR